jgi:23S rRNA (adenine2503-C2)-methyltransferase
MKCAFCQTGTLGLSRNLDAGEIVEEFLYLESIAGKLDNIVFMGMGEPMQNLGAIRRAIEILCHKDGRALSSKRITLSTCGIVKGIYDLADNGPSLRLAVSLTTANEDLRRELMPVSSSKENSLSNQIPLLLTVYLPQAIRSIRDLLLPYMFTFYSCIIRFR